MKITYVPTLNFRLALALLALITLIPAAAFANPKTVAECLADPTDDICVGFNLDRARLDALEAPAGPICLTGVYVVGAYLMDDLGVITHWRIVRGFESNDDEGQRIKNDTTLAVTLLTITPSTGNASDSLMNDYSGSCLVNPLL